jgi:hypothetical protein
MNTITKLFFTNMYLWCELTLEFCVFPISKNVQKSLSEAFKICLLYPFPDSSANRPNKKFQTLYRVWKELLFWYQEYKVQDENDKQEVHDWMNFFSSTFCNHCDGIEDKAHRNSSSDTIS